MLTKRINTFTVMLTAIFVLATVFTILPAMGTGHAYAASKGTIKNGPLNVRSGPGTNYSKLGTIDKGKTITITDTKKGKSGTKWYKFKFGSKNGYVSSAYVTIKAASSGTTTYTKAKTGVIKDGPLTVRSNAGTSYSQVGTLAKGKSVSLKGEKKDSKGAKWYRITFKGKTAYIHSSYVTVKPSSTNNAASGVTAYAKAKTGVVKDGPLTVRSDAGTSYTKLGVLAKGKSISLKGEKKDSKGIKWYLITFDSKNGYVHSDYITVKSNHTSQDNASTINKDGVVKEGPLNVRSGAGTSYSKIGSVAQGKQIKVKKAVKNTKGETWYTFAYTSSKTGYVLSSYVKLVSEPGEGSNLTDNEFDAWMDKQGFPASYQSSLRKLHKAHPEWIFKSHDTGIKWSSMLQKELRIGNNLVEPTSPASWKSKAPGAYSNGKWVVFDGRWNAASESITSYYLDPRNFLNETSIYQFMEHGFDAGSQNRDTIKSIVSKNSSCFMNNTSYMNNLYNAGVKSQVNPNVITAMVVMEQGWKGGSGLISGNNSGYKGFYNHFNIGAYTTSTMSSTQRGLWWAKGAGTGETSYGRPWNSIEKSLAGGAEYYASNYITKNQNTYYTKKFNVMNGLDKVATHEYMTNVSGAESEGKLLKYAYEADDNYPIVFYIPVYSGMPSKACPMP